MTTTIFEALAAEHREIDALFRRVLSARSREIEQHTFRILATRLLRLLRSERLVVYPHFLAIPGLREEVSCARLEHAEIETAVAYLRANTEVGLPWRVEILCLHARVRHLLAIEECALFPLARLTLPTEMSRRLAHDLQGVTGLDAEVANVSITYDLGYSLAS